jgi:hypothetical protein
MDYTNSTVKEEAERRMRERVQQQQQLVPLQ